MISQKLKFLFLRKGYNVAFIRDTKLFNTTTFEYVIRMIIITCRKAKSTSTMLERALHFSSHVLSHLK